MPSIIRRTYVPGTVHGKAVGGAREQKRLREGICTSREWHVSTSKTRTKNQQSKARQSRARQHKTSKPSQGRAKQKQSVQPLLRPPLENKKTNYRNSSSHSTTATAAASTYHSLRAGVSTYHPTTRRIIHLSSTTRRSVHLSSTTRTSVHLSSTTRRYKKKKTKKQNSIFFAAKRSNPRPAPTPGTWVQTQSGIVRTILRNNTHTQKTFLLFPDRVV